MKKKILNTIKENYLTVLFFLIIYIIFTIPLPYYIEMPGGAIDISKKIEIENSYKINGSLNMAYVGELKATIPLYLFAKVNKDYDIIKKEEIIASNETENDNELRGKLMLKEANDNAIIVAYNKANKIIKINSSEIYVTYIDESADTDLKIGDRIIEVNNIKITTKEDINKIIKNHNIGDKINFKVINNNKTIMRSAIVKKDKIIGIILTYKREFETVPKIKFNFDESESGSSGGLMMSLAIYDYLTKEDITKGKKIIGTGTIDENGNVGEIDGIKHKLKGAVNEKADIFLVPDGDNYKAAIKYKKEHNYDIEIVSVKTFDDALEYLKKCD